MATKKLTKRQIEKLEKQTQVRKDWVAALRSGEYKQGKGLLRRPGKTGDKFCCLGVLCEMAVKAGVIPAAKYMEAATIVGDRYGYGGGKTGPSTELPPKKVRDWAGITTENGTFDVQGDFPNTLTELNDNGKTFKAIAKIIESEPAGLFTAVLSK